MSAESFSGPGGRPRAGYSQYDSRFRPGQEPDWPSGFCLGSRVPRQLGLVVLAGRLVLGMFEVFGVNLVGDARVGSRGWADSLAPVPPPPPPTADALARAVEAVPSSARIACGDSHMTIT